MKRFLLFCLVMLLLLVSCSRESEISFDALHQGVATHYGEQGFLRADPDFTESNFGKPDFLSDSAVFLSERGEIGIFSLNDPARAAEMLTLVNDYLALEQRSVIELAALYPADELEARLARFENAQSGAIGSVVYYSLLDEKDAATLQGLLKG